MKYEYRLVSCNGESLPDAEEKLRALGEQGWRVISCVKDGWFCWTLERQKGQQ